MHHQILFIENDFWIRTQGAAILNDSGYATTCVRGGRDAVKLLSQSGDFDLLITDFQLADDINGLVVAAYWRQTRPRAPIIYSSHNLPALTGRLRCNEGQLHKPYGPTDLLHLVEDLIAPHPAVGFAGALFGPTAGRYEMAAGCSQAV